MMLGGADRGERGREKGKLRRRRILGGREVESRQW